MHELNIFLEHIYEAAEQRGETPGSVLEQARGFGYSGLECDIGRLSDRQGAKALFDGCGMRTASVYAFFDFPHDSADISREKSLRLLETAAYFGADKVLAVPGFISADEDRGAAVMLACERLGELCGLAAGYGMTVTVEDFDDVTSPCCDTAGLELLLGQANGLRLTFDTGNFAHVTEDALTAYERLKPYISHVHLKDRSRDPARAFRCNEKADISGRLMYPCETGGGYIPAERLVKRLISDGYTGEFSVEHFGAADQTEYMRRSAENVQKWIREAKTL